MPHSSFLIPFDLIILLELSAPFWANVDEGLRLYGETLQEGTYADSRANSYADQSDLQKAIGTCPTMSSCIYDIATDNDSPPFDSYLVVPITTSISRMTIGVALIGSGIRPFPTFFPPPKRFQSSSSFPSRMLCSNKANQPLPPPQAYSRKTNIWYAISVEQILSPCRDNITPR